ncbi:DMT family transporter [Legionella israelensis]|uniref:DMT family transporter n=1 Tax=Legionella israelensis TaxID=454 RepID=A0AAX1EGW4_9GAMM|nr:DMT family transporter [Legionella israelensis]QBR84333.1 DMT family transporter [Legionella israelensis]
MEKKKKAVLLFICSILLFALSSPALKLLIDHGKEIGLKYPDAIRFCNVLFVGNLCAGLVPFLFKNPAAIAKEVWHIPRRTFLFLMGSTFFTFLYPMLIYFALERTTVINVTLISQLDGVFFIIISTLIIGIKVSRNEIWGYSIITIGTFSILFYKSGFTFRIGDWLVVLATICINAIEVIDKRLIEDCSFMTITSVTNLFSAIIFFWIAYLSFGWEHFLGVFHGELWIIMLVYAGLTIVLADVLWLKALKLNISLNLVSKLSLLSPAITLLLAFFLLDEIPTSPEVFGIIVIFLGLFVTAFAKARPRKLKTNSVKT